MTAPTVVVLNDRTIGRVAGGLWLVGLALALGAGVFHLLTRDVPVDYYGVRGFQGVFGLTIGGIGWLIATRNKRNPIGWIFVGVGFISTLQNFNAGYATYSVARHEGALPFTDLFVWSSVWVWVLIVGPMSTWVVMLFPDGRIESRRQRSLAIFSGIAIAAFAVAMALSPGQAGESPVGVDNPYAISKSAADVLGSLALLYIAATIASIGVLVSRFRRSTGELRQQMKWITFAGSIAVTALIINIVQSSRGTDIRSFAPRFAAIIVIIGMIGIPVAAGVAILRYGLYEIDVVINKTIVYALLAVFITLVYGGVVIGVGALVGAGANTGLTIAATAIVAVAAQPMRARANRLANRLVFGKRASPYEALSEFSARLSEQTEDVLPRLARLMTEATAADRASVWLAVGAHLEPVGSWPAGQSNAVVALDGQDVHIPGADNVYPVRHEGELLGALAVSHPSNESLTAAEDRLIADLSAQAGLLLRNARLIAELRASRQRLVAAQDLERRRIERNLHDGAQQQLVALAVNLNLTGQIMDADPSQAKQMIEQLRADVTDAIENVRALAHGIYPPLLADRGLVAALEGQALKAPIPVTVEGNGLARYAQEVESAIYFCVLEALQNVAKYAGATGVKVRVAAEDRTLMFAIIDDGAGFDPRVAKRGAGLSNMSDRIDALGGALEVRSSPGAGTTIIGRVPAAPI